MTPVNVFLGLFNAMLGNVKELYVVAVLISSFPLLLILAVSCFYLFQLWVLRPNVNERLRNVVLMPPGPSPWPIYGSLHLLAADPNPWVIFRRLRKKYGDVFKITLGRQECVIVSSLTAIREVLIEKATSFSSRPNFLRYHALFGGSRDNSLALCDWSDLQRTRRKVAYPFVFPRSTNLKHLESVIIDELDDYVKRLKEKCSSHSRKQTNFNKFQLSATCANIFFRYFCSKRYDFQDKYFLNMVKQYDDIFHDINNGFAIDFLPWLAPFKLHHLFKLYRHGKYIRNFLLETLIKKRTQENKNVQEEKNEGPRDFVDVIFGRAGSSRGVLSNRDALYELEDLLGGHSAVASIWTRLLVQVVNRTDVKDRIRAEIDSVVGKDGQVRLCHRSIMPYVEAVILETLRVTTSPIVPHVATEDATIAGFYVKRGSMVFLNNYYLNLSEKHWNRPLDFDPDRFLNDAGHVTRPDHFLPFSTGQRSCLGYQIVHAVVFLTTVHIFQHFDVHSEFDGDVTKVDSKEISRDVECAKLSVYDNDVRAVLRPRN